MRLAPRLAVAIAVASCLAVLAPGLSRSESGSVWPGYRILLVESGIAEGEVLARTGAAGISRVLSESVQPVQISNFHTLETLSLQDCGKRLVEGDPRSDGYISGLRAWFRATVSGREYRVYYLPSGFPPSRLDKALSGLEADYLLPESGTGQGGSRSGLGIFILALIAFCLLALPGNGLAGALPVLSCGLALLPLATGGEGASCAATLILAFMQVFAPSLGLAVEEYSLSRRPARSAAMLVRGLPAFLAFLLPVLGFLALQPALILPAFLALASSLLALGSASFILSERTRIETARRRFVPVRIAGGRSPAPVRTIRAASRALFAPLAAVVLALSVAAVAEAAPSGHREPGGRSSAEILLPLPGKTLGPARLMPSEARDRASAHEPGGPPDLADWLVHRWYEESLFYESLDDRGVEPFATAVVPNPSEGGQSVVKAFDDAWARSAWRSLPQGGIEGLLLSLGGYAEVSVRALDAGDPRPLAPTRSLLYIILVAPPVLGVLPLDKRGIRRVRERKKTR